MAKQLNLVLLLVLPFLFPSLSFGSNQESYLRPTVPSAKNADVSTQPVAIPQMGESHADKQGLRQDTPKSLLAILSVKTQPPYGIHIGSFEDADKAVAYADTLRSNNQSDKDMRGVEIVSSRAANGKNYHKIILGPYESYDDAKSIFDKMLAKGQFARIVHFSSSGLPSATDKSKKVFSPDLSLVVDGDMILDVFMDHKIVYQGMLCIGKKGTLYVPLSELTLALEFAISVAPQKGQASGWFIDEDRKFSLDIDSQKLTVDGQNIALEPQDYFRTDEDIYLRAELLEKVFPFTLRPDYSNMRVEVDSSEPLPGQLRDMRNAERNLAQSSTIPLKYPISDLDYALMAPPRLDARISLGKETGKKRSEEGVYSDFSANYRGDLLFFSSSVYIQGNHRNNREDTFGIDNFTFVAEKLWPTNPYLRSLQLGDVVPPSLTDVPGGGQERGAVISNRNPQRATDYDTKTFTGTTLPGWDVELYKNNRLIRFTTAGDDGRYSFPDVTLDYGNNEFKLVLYGTEGQKEIREETINVGRNSVSPGEIIYEASLTQQDTDVWDPQRGSHTTDQGEVRGRIRLSTGLGENVTLHLGGARDTHEERTKKTATAGVVFGINDSLLQFDSAINDWEGRILSGALRGDLFGHTANFSHRQQLGKYQIDDSMRSQTSVTLSNSYEVTPGKHFSYGVSLSRQLNESPTSTDTLYYSPGLDLGYNDGNLWISNNLNARYYETPSKGSGNDIIGDFTARRHFNNQLFLRGSGSYRLADDPKLKSAKAVATMPFGQKYSAEAGLEVDNEPKEGVTFHAQINRSMEWGTLFGRFESQDNDSRDFRLGFSTALDFNPHSGKPELHKASQVSLGGLSCRVFKDNDNDGKYSEGDELLEGVEVSASQTGMTATTDKDGVAYLPDLPPMLPTDIELIPESLKDPRYTHPEGGIAIIPRKGRIYAIDFPVIATSEIDGTVFALTPGGIKAKRGVPIELLDEQGVIRGKAVTDPDGFYFMTGIAPGEYTLRVDDEYREIYDVHSYPKTPFVVGLQSSSDHPLLIGTTEDLEKHGETMLVEANRINSNSLEQQLIAQINGKAPARKEYASVDDQAMPPRATQRKIALEVFASERTAERAVKHFKKRHANIIANNPLSFIKFDDSYVVFATVTCTEIQYRQLIAKLSLNPYALQLSNRLNEKEKNL